MKHEIEIPDELIEGYEPTGEYREVKKDGWFLIMGVTKQWNSNAMSQGKHIILRPKRWKPKEGDHYYFITLDGFVKSKRWDGELFEIDCYNFHNCFKTKEQAEKARDKIAEVLRGMV